MSYINAQATNSYKEALQATESLEAPSLGFCRPSEYKGAISSSIATIKQANTQIQLLVTILEKIETLEERLKRVEATIQKSGTPSLPEEVIHNLTEKIKSLKITEKPKEQRGQLRVFTDPFTLFSEAKSKEKNQDTNTSQEEGTLLLIIFRDNRWQGDQAIFATMEVDLTQGSQLVYVIPDTMLTISDFHRNIQISILARGYKGWQNSEANILVTRGMVGRLSNTPNVGFAYEIQNVVDYLITHAVRALPGRRYNTRELLGQNWIINQSSINIPMQPVEVSTRNLLDGRISIQFDNYQAAVTASQPYYNQRDEEIPSDEEEVHHQIIAVLLEDPEEILMVKRISNSAILPKRKTEGSAGYDLAINREQFVPKKDKSLLTTGICIQIPKRTYARIAPRSSAAIRGLIIMGGVVDEDYRGEEQAHPECSGCAYCHDGTETAEPYEFYVAPTPGYIDDREYIERRAMTPGDDPMEIAISDTRRILRRSKDYRNELQQQLDNLPSSSSSSNHFCMVITNTDDDDYISYLQYLALQDSPFITLEEFTNPFAKAGGEEAEADETKHWDTDYPMHIIAARGAEEIEAEWVLLDICKKNGLILSPTKMKLGSPTIEFLGATIGESKIKLQAHIITKIADFSDQELQTTKGLRSWLGLLNYARSYIPNLGKIPGPLYAKTSPKGEKKMNSQDWALVKKVKAIIKTLPDLTIPPVKCYMLIETDGCMEGWGGICKWKLQKHDSKLDEKICAYASGKFSPPKSTIDAEIYAVMNSLNSFKIYYLDKEELLIRTDCQTIISFFNKSAQNKPSRVRWIAFTDFITGLGIPVHFQHIEGKDNLLADALSRLLCVITGPWIPTEKDLLILIQMEKTLKQLSCKPNTAASHHLAGLIIFWSNTKNWPNPVKTESSIQRSTRKEPIWKTLSRQQQETSSTVSESWSLSAGLKKMTLNSGAHKNKGSTSKMPFQL
ncbi:hypothetical protein ZIOFF_028405 [Zingiber officinale]|uniref:Reverse transcriptase RNase H-like domain-containing protein n=1 Tax=Zingiber officinale TaxID=94328 RepID=A0A8J5GMV4_ZINOF|nr:hypothetical protein ZIOFF_028405 [Zingiber officinale]